MVLAYAQSAINITSIDTDDLCITYLSTTRSLPHTDFLGITNGLNRDRNVLATPNVMSGQDLWQWSLMATVQCFPTATMTWYLTHSHYLDTEPTSPCPLPITVNNAECLARRQQAYILKSLVWLNQDLNRRVRFPWSAKTSGLTYLIHL